MPTIGLGVNYARYLEPGGRGFGLQLEQVLATPYRRVESLGKVEQQEHLGSMYCSTKEPVSENFPVVGS